MKHLDSLSGNGISLDEQMMLVAIGLTRLVIIYLSPLSAFQVLRE